MRFAWRLGFDETADWASRTLFAFALVLPTLGLYLSRGMAFAPAVFALALALAWILRRQDGHPAIGARGAEGRFILSVPLIAFSLLVAWGWTSALWAVEPRETLDAAWKTTVILALGLFGIAMARTISADRRGAIGRAAVIGLAVGLACLTVEWAFNGVIATLLYGHRETPGFERGMLWLRRGAPIIALLAWPALLWLWKSGSRWQAGGLALVTFVLIKQLQITTVTYGFLGSVILFVFFRRRPTWLAGLLAASFVIAIFAMPPAAKNLDPLIALQVPDSQFSSAYEGLRARFRIWEFVGERIAEKPLFGWGMDASRSVPGGADHRPGTEVNVLPLHPHNLILQWWLELGLIGAALAAAAVASLALGMTRWIADSDTLAAGLCLLALVGVISFMSYGAWQSWWLGTQAVVATMFAAVASSGPSRHGEGTPQHDG